MNTYLVKSITSFSILILTVIGCQKTNGPDNPQPGNGQLLVKIYDSLDTNVNDTFYYNAEKKLTKLKSTNGSTYCDTFLYSNDLLIHSQYNGGDTIRFLTPYSKTDYVYSADKLVSSNYYLGTTQITNSVYTLDSAGRVIKVTQKVINPSPGVIPLYTTRFEYDAESNLRKIYYKEGSKAEYMITELLEYDNKVNPFHYMPVRFDYNLHSESVLHFSKNNVGRIVRYNASGGSSYDIFNYEYDTQGRISKMLIRVSNGTTPTGTKYFVYK